uniref:Endonuclease/exonuclease/phosphatase family domain-containing protein 1 n=1 Tax=Salmo trutta TaxID=8032 RepID=A0A674DTY9_SALTR
MGGNLGCHRSIPKDPTDFSNSKRKFSAACNFSHILVNQERLNINTATEEELMTLPGVNRTVAQNIVEYRNCIAGFKKVEDLALVSGIGAGKLEIIRLEICVSSRTSSSQHSPSSLRKDFEPHLSCTGMNINTATPAQLMSIRGITDKIAKNIVEYRMENGPFKSIEDLVRVNNINSSLLDKIRFQVFVERSRTPSTNTNGGLVYTTKSHPSPTSFSLRSEDMELPPGGPTRIMSVRPNVEPPPGMRDGKAVVRVATWNLQNCSCEKANNPGVKEVVCMTLLENDIKLLAVQDLVDREALDKFCVELNQGSLDSVRKWRGPRGVWKSTVSEKPTGLSNKIGSSELTMVNVHMRAPAVSGAEESNVRNHHSEEVKAHRLTSSIQNALKVQKGLVMLGDFGVSPQSSELDQLRKERLSPLVPPNMFTNISTRSPQGSLCLDNIWVSKSLKKIYAGHCVVVREGLTNPWIPDNWSWGGVASDHCPVMAEFFVDGALKELRNRVAVVERGESMSKHER